MARCTLLVLTTLVCSAAAVAFAPPELEMPVVVASEVSTEPPADARGDFQTPEQFFLSQFLDDQAAEEALDNIDVARAQAPMQVAFSPTIVYVLRPCETCALVLLLVSAILLCGRRPSASALESARAPRVTSSAVQTAEPLSVDGKPVDEPASPTRATSGEKTALTCSA